MQMTLFLHLTALPAWLALPRADRNRVGAEAMAHAAFPEARLFDAEAFTALCSDIAMLSAPTPGELYAGIERLRDTPLFTKPYFRLDAIYPAIEDGFRSFEASQ